MAAPLFSPDSADLIVLDASVVINLNATACASTILRALPNKFVVTDVVVGELETCARAGRKDGQLLNALIADGDVTKVRLGDSGLRYFETLVIGDAVDTLDDGEAATIAHALETGGAALLDERKATRICAERYPALAVVSTVDLLASDGVIRAVGREGLGDAVTKSLMNARMQVPPRHRAWIMSLIGLERAAACPSLPKFR